MREKRFEKHIATRIPKDVYEALQKLAKERRKDFPRYTESDAMRSAIINHLKAKGFLEKGKDYL